MLRRIRRSVFRWRGGNDARGGAVADAGNLLNTAPPSPVVEVAPKETTECAQCGDTRPGMLRRAREAAKAKAKGLVARIRGPRVVGTPRAGRAGRASLHSSPEDNSMTSENFTDVSQRGLGASEGRAASCGSLCSQAPRQRVDLVYQEFTTSREEVPRCDLSELEAVKDALRRERAGRDMDRVAAAAAASALRDAEARLAAQEGRVQQLERQLEEALQSACEAARDEVRVGKCTYSCGNVLGSGGFGTVYAGTLPVAVKKYSGPPVDAEVMRTLHRNVHPHIVTLYCTLSTEHGEVFVMELAGQSLHHVIKQQRDGLAAENRIMWASEAVQAVRHLESLAVVHGDVKTSNYLLVDDHVKLADLDSARKEGAPIGAGVSVHYAPPEAFSHDAVLATPWDAWSVAVVVHEVLTSHMPFGVTGALAELPAQAVAMAGQILTKQGTQLTGSAVWEAAAVYSWRMLQRNMLPPGTVLGPRPRTSALEWLSRCWVLNPLARGSADYIAAQLSEFAASLTSGSPQC